MTKLTTCNMNTLLRCRMIRNYRVKNLKYKKKEVAHIVSIAKFQVKREISKRPNRPNRQ